MYAFIEQDGEVVVFEQPDAPEAGVQIPGGTVEAGEDLAAAVLREAFEETGLQGLAIVRYLGVHGRDMSDYGKDEVHQRHFYLLRCNEVIPQTWAHWEMCPSDGSAPIQFRLYRVSMRNLPPLIAEMDVFKDKVWQILGE